ncbi:MAG: citramalate synthase [Halobacteriovoraceae bacterium]|nr:citramalate synthase [Halobacteriovoraceae bacterium]
MLNKIEIYDTTLRDGTQGAGISFSLEEKIFLTHLLNELGIPYIEGGWPGSNPKDEMYFKKIREKKKKGELKGSQVFAFSSTRRKGVKTSEDFFLSKMVESKADGFCLFGKTWDRQATDALGVTLGENLNIIKESILFLKEKTKKPVFFDCEHFFDGYKSNKEYAIDVLKTALKAGADRVILCDTNGGTFSHECQDIIKELKTLSFPLHNFGFHGHNDCGMALSNSITTVREGFGHIQGTINGIGERCGNTDLVSVISNLQLKMKIQCIPSKKIKGLFSTSKKVWELTHGEGPPNQPFVGVNSFAHKGGIHVSALQKAPEFYEHINPNSIGNRRHILISELSGQSNIINTFGDRYPELKDKRKVKSILHAIQDKEKEGLSYEGADASLELFMRRVLGHNDSIMEKNYLKINDLDFGKKKMSEASLSLNFRGDKTMTVSLGVGPVDALSKALRKALTPFYPEIKNLKLTDYHVKIIDGHCGTMAKVRVSIKHQFLKNKAFTTIGMSENIIEASWQAFESAFTYFAFLKKDQSKKVSQI